MTKDNDKNKLSDDVNVTMFKLTSEHRKQELRQRVYGYLVMFMLQQWSKQTGTSAVEELKKLFDGIEQNQTKTFDALDEMDLVDRASQTGEYKDYAKVPREEFERDSQQNLHAIKAEIISFLRSFDSE